VVNVYDVGDYVVISKHVIVGTHYEDSAFFGSYSVEPMYAHLIGEVVRISKVHEFGGGIYRSYELEGCISSEIMLINKMIERKVNCYPYKEV